MDAILNNSKRSMMPAGHHSNSDSTLLHLPKSSITWFGGIFARLPPLAARLPGLICCSDTITAVSRIFFKYFCCFEVSQNSTYHLLRMCAYNYTLLENYPYTPCVPSLSNQSINQSINQLLFCPIQRKKKKPIIIRNITVRAGETPIKTARQSLT